MRGGLSTTGRSASLWLRAWRFLNARREDGFTVIEVIIVLAITGMLFVSAAIMISGRQNRTAFEQAVRKVQTQIQSQIDEVVIGHYPNNGNIQCEATGSGPDIDAGFNEQGTNGDCIFMGKVVQFGVKDTDPEQYKVYTIAGLRTTAAGDEVKTRVQAMAKLIAPTTADPSIPDEVEEVILEGGLGTGFVQYGTTAAPNTSAGFAIWQSLATTSGGTLNSGAQAAHIGAIPNTTLGMTQLEFVDAAVGSFLTSPLDDVNGVRLCFVSSSTEQSGLITLGGNNRRLSVILNMKSNTTCS